MCFIDPKRQGARAGAARWSVLVTHQMEHLYFAPECSAPEVIVLPHTKLKVPQCNRG